MTRQGAFTAVAEIDKAKVDALHNLLSGIGGTVNYPNCPITFGDIKTVHFMRWVVIGAGEDAAGREYPPYLVLETNFDEPLDGHLEELARVGGTVFDEIYSHCKGYDVTKVPAGERVRYRVDYLKARSVRYAAFYVGTRGRSVDQIRREAKLRDDIQNFLDTTPDLPAEPDGLCARLREQFTTGGYEWVKGEAGAPPAGVSGKVVLGAFGLILLAAWAVSWLVLGWAWWLVPAVALGLAALFLAFLRLYERLEPRPKVPPAGAAVDALTSREDFVVQNQLTHFVAVKPYIFRRLTLRLVLRTIDLLGRVLFVRGALGGIPSIHFARWVILDRGRRLLFMSNFDGSWENYLGDFIDKAAPGLTAVWSNTIDCPPARLLVFDGARDERGFKEWTRRNQLVTQVWYSAYRDLSVENINNNTKIRQGLMEPLTGERARRWLALL